MQKFESKFFRVSQYARGKYALLRSIKFFRQFMPPLPAWGSFFYFGNFRLSLNRQSIWEARRDGSLKHRFGLGLVPELKMRHPQAKQRFAIQRLFLICFP